MCHEAKGQLSWRGRWRRPPLSLSSEDVWERRGHIIFGEANGQKSTQQACCRRHQWEVAVISLCLNMQTSFCQTHGIHWARSVVWATRYDFLPLLLANEWYIHAKLNSVTLSHASYVVQCYRQETSLTPVAIISDTGTWGLITILAKNIAECHSVCRNCTVMLRRELPIYYGWNSFL